MRMFRFFLMILLGLGLLSACGGEDGGGQGGPGTKKDTQGGEETIVVTDPCKDKVKNGQETDVDCGGTCSPCAKGKLCGGNADCATGFCGMGYLCADAACGNGVQDGTETGTDCGGGCAACLGSACQKDTDCAAGYCKGGLCDAPSCSDGVKNGMETGSDCGGGGCAQCPDGQPCMVNVNCLNGFCKEGFCATPSCTDGVLNQLESDVDCGGTCSPCAVGKHCSATADCDKSKCQDGVCTAVEASCDDGIKNGSETEVDCGGGCNGCGYGKDCNVGADCASGQCADGKCGAPAECNDGDKNGDETDEDCGGMCTPCPVGKYCLKHEDCMSIACVYGVCEKPTCEDQIKNQGEFDVDCGGTSPCEKCGDGKGCGAHADCESGRCENGTCTSCDDGKKNGDEVDVDCGGSCNLCGLGQHCNSKDDCYTGGCEGGKCCQVNACGICTDTPKEICNGKDDDCNGYIDDGEDMWQDQPLCPKQAGPCAGSKAECKGTAGWQCDDELYKSHNWDYAPNEKEECWDSIDNDCDGKADFDDSADCCQAKCDGKQCGDDGCGGSCGTCGATDECKDGKCVLKCGGDPAHTCKGYCEQTYGSDGKLFCSQSYCEAYAYNCMPDYQSCCVGTCTPMCTGKVCGNDGCGNANGCGTCSAGKTCNDAGQCVSGGGGLTQCLGTGSPSAATCILTVPDTMVGCCKDTWTVWCENGKTYCIQCGSSTPNCGWDSSNGYYNCWTSSTSDPNGSYPRTCTFAAP
jgi:hypothetical protein